MTCNEDCLRPCSCSCVARLTAESLAHRLILETALAALVTHTPAEGREPFFQAVHRLCAAIDGQSDVQRIASEHIASIADNIAALAGVPLGQGGRLN